MAYSVSRRTREVGHSDGSGRTAERGRAARAQESGTSTALGLGGGLWPPGSATRVIQSFLYNVSRHDPVTTASVCVLLAVCGLLAALIPARRAASIDPMEALRNE